MAERRMFAKTIIDSDAFLEMPMTAQALYFHLAMRADDDGFVNNPKRIQRSIGGNDDDYKLLLAKRFILAFDSGIIVIKHWKIHNYIRGDRKKDTAYPEEMALLETKDNGAYTFRDPQRELEEIEESKPETMRQKAYRESSLPYSFDYKIRNAFYGKPCPICGCLMRGTVDECGIESNIRRPSIQHNIPISKGGKHELGNISVICHQCNITLRDTETDKLNAEDVIEEWERLSNVRQMSGKCQANVSVGKDSIGKDNNINIYGDSANAKSAEIDDFFSKIWQLYPKKLGKGQVSDKQKRKLLSIGYDEIARCVDRYKIEIEGKDKQYVMYGSTFFNSGYVDYLDENYETDKPPEEEDDAFAGFQ